MLDLARLDLHDAVLCALGVDWATSTCVAHLRRVGPDGGRPLTLQWHGVTSLEAPHRNPWGPSTSVLEGKSKKDGTFELVLQSGDTIRIQASGCSANESDPIERRYAGLVVDALVDAGLVSRDAISAATAAATNEILARRSLGDL